MEHSPPQGWYPDPARRGRQRWWDGTRWTDQVRRLPGAPTRPVWLASLIAVCVAVVVIAAGLVVFGLGRGQETSAPASPSAPSTPAGTGGPVRTTPLPGPDPTACAVGEPGFRGSHPEDGRLRGGGLVMPTPEGWIAAEPDRMTYAFDVDLVAAPDDSGWAGLGAVRIDDPYSTPEQASATITACLDDLAEPGTLRVAHSQPVILRGAHRAHEFIGVLDERGQKREFRVVVADLHSPESLAIYVRVVDWDSPNHAAVTTAEAALTGA